MSSSGSYYSSSEEEVKKASKKSAKASKGGKKAAAKESKKSAKASKGGKKAAAKESKSSKGSKKASKESKPSKPRESDTGGAGGEAEESNDNSSQEVVITKDAKVANSTGKEGAGEGGSPNDPEFPECLYSIAGSTGAKAQKKYGGYVWRRPENFKGGKVKLFSGISPNDIEQGMLGDCYFLSALSVLAEHPNNIKALFHSTKYKPKTGTFEVNMCKNGVWDVVTVNDYFPCPSATEGPAFTHSKSGELWPLVLEKAYAKVHGSYGAIEGGQTAHALEDLTGAPSQFFRVSPDLTEEQLDELFNRLGSYEHEGYVMSCSIGKGNEEAVNGVGLVPGHAFGLLDVRRYQSSRLLKIRNPWGNAKEWTGAWGDDDTENWDKKAKKKLKFTDADDGTFWMLIEDFVKYFTGVSVLFLKKKAKYEVIDTPLHNGEAFVRIRTTNKKTKTYFRLIQEDKRSRPGDKDYKYLPIRFTVLDDSGRTVASSKYGPVRSVFADFELVRGIHYVVIQTDSNEDTTPWTAEEAAARRKEALAKFLEDKENASTESVESSEDEESADDEESEDESSDDDSSSDSDSSSEEEEEEQEETETDSSASDSSDDSSDSSGDKKATKKAAASKGSKKAAKGADKSADDEASGDATAPAAAADAGEEPVDFFFHGPRVVRFASYSDKGLKEFSVMTRDEFDTAIASGFRKLVEVDGKETTYEWAEMPEVIQHVYGDPSGVVGYFWKNTHATKTFGQNISFKLENMLVVHDGDEDEKDHTDFSMILGPGESEFYLLKHINPGAFRYGCGYSNVCMDEDGAAVHAIVEKGAKKAAKKGSDESSDDESEDESSDDESSDESSSS